MKYTTRVYVRCDWCGKEAPPGVDQLSAQEEAAHVGWQLLAGTAACSTCLAMGRDAIAPADLPSADSIGMANDAEVVIRSALDWLDCAGFVVPPRLNHLPGTQAGGEGGAK